MENAWYLIANPTAGGGLNFNEWEGILETLKRVNVPHEEVISETKEHIHHLAREAVFKGYRNFVAVGGDGTLNDLLNGLLSQKEVPSDELTLTAFPIGTGCDWSKMYGITRSVELGTRLILEGRSVRQDIGLITYLTEGKEQQRYFINVAGLGYDAYVVKETQDQVKQGAWTRVVYLWTAIRCLNLYKPQHTRIFSSNFEKEGKALFSNVGICKYSGGGMRMVPKAQPLDGLFDITFMEGLTRSQVLVNILKLYNGNLYRHKKAHHYRSGIVNIEGKEPIPIEADGELLGTTPARFELLPGAIRVRVPSSYKG